MKLILFVTMSLISAVKLQNYGNIGWRALLKFI